LASSIHIIELDPKLDVLQVLRAFESEPTLLLLDSAARHRERDSRYSMLTADPVAECRIDRVEFGDSPFETLRRWQRVLPDPAASQHQDLPPFCGGIAGLLSYELAHAFERLPRSPTNEFQSPALLAGLFDWALVWDHIDSTARAYVLELSVPGGSESCFQRTRWIQERLAQSSHRSHGDGASREGACREGEAPAEPPVSRFRRIEPTSEIYSDVTRDEHVAAVRRVIEYIRAGDIFQANLSQRLMAPWNRTATDLYARIRTHNPAPFCGLLKADDFSVISASPERFLKVDRNGHVETRPIKGTRRRPRSPIADLYAGSELTDSEKDRAENVMIVDLLRNDLSRSCSAGTVKVTGLCEIERFETVLHLVSTIIGRLRPDRDVWDLIAGCFPGGSITGAPKIRAMEIITELESSVRGAYCGNLFALGPSGDFDSSILIRTFTLRNGWLQFPVGGGIVADSDPLDEYRETLHKASGLIRALR
jgi:para-aminobenzoate synthetase component 1